MWFFEFLVTVSISTLVYVVGLLIYRWYTDRLNDKAKKQKQIENAKKQIFEAWLHEIEGFNLAINEVDEEIIELRQNKYSRNYKLRYFYLEKELNFFMTGFKGKLI